MRGICAMVALAGTCAAPALAQSPAAGPGPVFPSKPIRYVVPFGAGASPDVVARILGERLTKLWGQQVLVDNRVGGAGMLGTVFVAKAPPDGHTLLQCNIAPNAIGISLYAKVPYDQIRDFAPITRIGMTPNIISVHPSVPFKSVKEFIAYAKAQPGKLSYASGVVGTSPHLSMELLKLKLKFDIVHIPYKVAAQGISDTMAGQVPVNISNFPSVLTQVQHKRLRPLAVTGAQRVALLPEVPTMQEAGVPDFDVNAWYGVCAPGATPAMVLEKLNADITSVLRMADVRERLTDLAVPPSPTTREEFDQFIRAEIARWAQVIRDAGIPKQ